MAGAGAQRQREVAEMGTERRAAVTEKHVGLSGGGNSAVPAPLTYALRIGIEILDTLSVSISQVIGSLFPTGQIITSFEHSLYLW